MDNLYNVESYELIEFAKKFRDLGDAVGEQLIQILDNPETDEVNLNAIKLIKEELYGLNKEIDEAIDCYFY